MGLSEKAKTSYEIFLLWNEQVDKSQWVRLETAQQLRKDLTDEIHRLDAEVAKRNAKIAEALKILDEKSDHSYLDSHIDFLENQLERLRGCLAGDKTNDNSD